MSALLLLLTLACAQDTSSTEAHEPAHHECNPDEMEPDSDAADVLDPDAMLEPLGYIAQPEFTAAPPFPTPAPTAAELEQRVDQQIERVEALIRAMEQLQEDDVRDTAAAEDEDEGS